MEDTKIFVPNNFYCPITGELMNDPVTDKEGNTYEKLEILKWILRNKTSPITRNYLDKTHLTNNKALKRSIESIKDKIHSDQLKIDSQLASAELKQFTKCLSDIKLNSYYFDNKLFVNIQTPDIDVRPPVDIVLCIDVSYSMFDEATLKGDSNETVSHGFSVLSLTIASAKTILHSLNENDNISIVTYSSEAKTIFENMSCSPENKSLIEDGLNQLKPISNTNMWSGIIRSLDILRQTSPPNKQKGILLLTDGIPNVEPPRGHENMLKKYFSDYNFKCMISCYGFGYNLDSELLMNLSSISGGDGYSFIPDASILGNVFIHGLSNLFTTAVYNPKLKITLKKDIRFMYSKREIEVELDSLKYGQDKNLVFELDTSRSLDSSELNNFAKVSLSFNDIILETDDNRLPDRNYYNENKFRHEAISVINQCVRKKKFNDTSFRDILIGFITKLESESSNSYIQDLLYDMNGQVKEALNMTSQGEREDWFTRWGIHYLRSLQGAYQHELCNNFKDRGICNFGGKLFNQLRNEISDVFDGQPPPKRDIPIRVNLSRSGSQSASVSSQQAPVNMSMYNNAGGGCCAEGSRVLMENGSYKKAEEIQKGDIVKTCKIIDSEIIYSTSSIECVVLTKCEGGKINMVTIDALKITPYHPIIQFSSFNIKRNWIFPIDINDSCEIECNSMYTFVVKNRESLFVEDSILATYGHNLQEDVIKHDYFGTDSVINDLKRYPSYEQGLVELTQDKFIKDKDKVVAISM